ncbi:hypothetical protein EJ110_NYTH34283 [Nymphaea thermarum]|nr:hypothetical protein EJ110_NYTH34283 [Nymphaea thermarum]
MRETAAKAILRGVRALGHRSVEIREDGKQFIFFCSVCLTPCYSDSALFDHLGGSLHSRRYAAAELTLLGSNPWPFNDGVFFFHDLDEEKQLHITNYSEHKCNTSSAQLLLTNHKPDSSAEQNASQLVLGNKGDNSSAYVNVISASDLLGQVSCVGDASLQVESIGHDKKLKMSERQEVGNLVISRVLYGEELSSLWVNFLGCGGISIRASKGDGISKIWCAWLGQDYKSDTYGDVATPDCDFAVIIFPYSDDLGRERIGSDLNPFCIFDGRTKDAGENGVKRKGSFCGQSDSLPGSSAGSSGDSRAVFDSSYNEATCLPGNKCSLVLASDVYEERIQQERVLSNKSVRKELRRRQRLASERLCGICQQRMLRGKDVATLLNKKTGNLACSSRNTHGAFHVFHISCLIHWILFCESKVWHSSKSTSGRRNAGSKKQVAVESGAQRTPNGNSTFSTISSVFCPECQGSGLKVEDVLEVPKMPLSEVCSLSVSVNIRYNIASEIALLLPG